MASAGLFPQEENNPFVLVPKERLAEFDRVMAQGQVEAIIEALKREEDARRSRTR